MRAAILSDGRFSVESVPDPRPLPGGVVLRVAACGICGTDHGIFKNRLLPDGVILGHEFAGTVVEVGEGVSDWQEGDRAAVLPMPFCGSCELCLNDKQNLCRYGLQRTIGCGGDPGGLAEYAAAPSGTLRRLPLSLDVRLGALVEPLAVALHAVNLGNVRPGTRVGILGLGPLGLFSGLIARQYGGLAFGLDHRPSRVACAHDLGLGAFASDDQADERIRDLTNGGPDVVIEASGRPESIERAATLARVGGRVVLVSSYHAPAEIKPGRWLTRGISLLPSIAYTPQEFETALDLLATRRIDAHQLVTAVHSLRDTQAVFERFETQSDAIKILLDPALERG
ncbi:MAG TPA: alcohol dehydrogenase catalytic domain-containing protein [Candidatus Binatia bacterium]|nr:alcohol dehydrogenase catalytic domain-containing protein [Candidatus Binatia bacterium]